jgi:hypothetical protein
MRSEKIFADYVFVMGRRPGEATYHMQDHNEERSGPMTKMSFRLRTIAMATAAMAITAGAMAGPALADEWHHRGPVVHERHWHPHPVFYAQAPTYAPAYGTAYGPSYGYVAPAPIYAPRPVPIAPPVSFNLVLPLRFN